MKKHSEKRGLLLIKCRYCNKKYERIILNSHENVEIDYIYVNFVRNVFY